VTEDTSTHSFLANRIAKYAELTILDTQSGHGMPLDVADIIWSRKLMPAIARADAGGGPFGKKAPIIGAGDISMTFAACPPGTGPSLHAHRKTYETFTVMQGSFEFSVGDKGEEKVVLQLFDVISVPPGHHRAFKNISHEEGILQVVITGGIHDQDDIYFPAETARELESKDPKYLEYVKKIGLQFEG
jgi:mannose-6-phosphate isomerase-like protein (cupin superfamily)